jgi:hypothetical protein
MDFYDWDQVIYAILDLQSVLQELQSLVSVCDKHYQRQFIFHFLLVSLFKRILYVVALNGTFIGKLVF